MKHPIIDEHDHLSDTFPLAGHGQEQQGAGQQAAVPDLLCQGEHCTELYQTHQSEHSLSTQDTEHRTP